MRECSACELCRHRKSIVWGSGNTDSGLMIIGEAPGKDEDEQGIPFVGKAGRELDYHYLQQFARVPRHEWYATNCVRCRPPKNRDPKPEEVAACRVHLMRELEEVKPRVVGLLGRFATEALLGENSHLDVIHGIPQRSSDGSQILVPCYHPAAGMHDSRKMISIQRDFEALGKAVRGEITPEQWRDEYPEPKYGQYVPNASTLVADFSSHSTIDILAADTESNPDGSTWSLQLSGAAGTGGIIFPSDLEYDRRVTSISSALLILHHAVHDLPILRRHCQSLPVKILDTMLMAYLLQDEPQGLKALAYRHCGMKMDSYEDVVRDAQTALARRYLRNVVAYSSWPKPEPVLVWAKGEPKIKKPWAIDRKAKSALDSKDPYERWQGIPPEEGRGIVEAKLGRMPTAGLRDVKISEAVYYACRDADATYRIFPRLWSRIKEHGLEQIFWIDSGIVDMIIDMMQYGMPVSKGELVKLSIEFGASAERVESEIHRIVGEYVNPGSPDQVADLLFRKLGLRSRKKTKSGKDSTDQKYLEQLRGQHEVVGKILEWRKYAKLKSTYADALQESMDEKGRVHPQILHTRTSTGRLATKSPNVQNQPVRSKEGRMIRDCFIAEPGCTLVSADYAGIELRCVADLSGDERMCDVYRRNGDLHSETARLIFGVEREHQDPYKHRIPSKTANFSIIYGVSAAGLHDTILKNGGRAEDWSEDRCEELIRMWYDAYPGVRAFMQLQEQRARRYGYVWDKFGRIRRIPEVRSSIKSVVAAGIREAGNQPVQSTAQGIMKIAMGDMIPVYRHLQQEGWTVRPLLQIHDDLLWEVEERRAGLFYQILKAVMENAVRLSIPVIADGKIGPVWGSMKSIEEG